MLDQLIGLAAAHYCYGCAKIGRPLCENCKYDIISEPIIGCILCKGITADSICKGCQTVSSIKMGWCGGVRTGALERLIDAYKFEYVRAAHRDIAAVMVAVLPVVPKEAVLVPIPTISRHIRQRGFDHALLLSRRVATQTSLTVSRCLERNPRVSEVQTGSSRDERLRQAKRAFFVNKSLDSRKIYILLDDITTTGATLIAAAQCLQKAGASTIWCVTAAQARMDE